MLRITRGEESKLTSWYFEIDRGLLVMILALVVVGAITMITAGSAQAAKMGQPWFFFIKKAFPFYMLGLACLFGCSMLNKRSVIRVSILCLIVGLFGLFCGCFVGCFFWLFLLLFLLFVFVGCYWLVFVCLFFGCLGVVTPLWRRRLRWRRRVCRW